MALLEMSNVSIEYETDRGHLRAVDEMDLTIEPGETLGLVGESGSGKTTATKPILGLLDSNGRVTGGEILFEGRDLTALSEEALRQEIRWQKISHIPQNAMAALDPVFTVGDQIEEVILAHTDQTKGAARDRTAALLTNVGLDPNRARDYPHELSGGQRQRVTIALALALSPSLIIADEPTTGLDVVVQDEILELIDDIQAEIGCAMIFITHDMSVIAEISDHIAVMYAGRVMEFGSIRDVFKRSAHPYTIGLQNSFPRMERNPAESSLITIPGSSPELYDPPDGCRFIDRCPFATGQCHQLPPMAEVSDGHHIECYFPDRSEEFRTAGRHAETWSGERGEVTE